MGIMTTQQCDFVALCRTYHALVTLVIPGDVRMRVRAYRLFCPRHIRLVDAIVKLIVELASNNPCFLLFLPRTYSPSFSFPFHLVQSACTICQTFQRLESLSRG